MSHRPLKLLVALAVAVLPAAARADPPAHFAERVQGLLHDYGVPGATVAIVEDGRTTMAQGFGVTDLSAPRPVDADTIFSIGSTSKAFTVAALAILVDQGRIGWDDKVIDRLPWFRMYDPWVTREMTIRDLLVHRSGLGLGAGDLMFVPRSDLTRRESVRRLQYIRPATSFRSGYAYDNVLYMVAGQLIEEVTGQSWEQFVRENVFRPLAMTHSVDSEHDRLASPDHARPHGRLNGAIRGTGDQVPLALNSGIADNVAPAGALAVSASDMTHWLNVQLAHGALPDGGRLFTEAQSAEMWTPVVVQPNPQLPPELSASQPMFQAYALGWEVQDYRGTKIVWHSGAVFGSLAAVVLIPDRHIGFFIAVNSEEGEIVRGLMNELLDHYLGLPRGDWPERYHAFREQRAQRTIAMLQAPAAQPARVGPSLPLARYTGDYTDPWYGTISVREQGGHLTVAFPHTPGLTATLDHWQYDTFRTRFNDPGMEPADMTFQLDAEGHVARITMRAVSPLADFSFDYQDLDFRPATASPSP